MSKKGIHTSDAPKAIGPYSQAVRIENFLFCSGQVGINPKTNKIVDGGIKKQTKQVIENLIKVLKAAGGSINNVVKTTVYLMDLGEFEEMNKVYAEFFKKPYPARATVQVAKLPRGAKIEIEAVAYIN
ncbi:reactive intermediate/imine deaminase [Candidatus Gottesmanbacteria bacterium CG11_big_fil_rev_8_21_14_0_20_37_11]|uniref:Reactive intermediate/imine deaminase n=3 Tax=Candidatus Gottesmaniibacteriota TaxID=1752720 RepID=A0A2M7RSZ7_9BACT|nr:MAG: hypothetical protein AUJ73_03605 [Candidatus Gottesmanbacteria bacterium CG1_02_37_22]PIP32815.1 MAG: reactive intermediate/imine deaminase [Candidatus Gottesmanbacteria bacterium CG23_combo_of_CG06-09_8_20_14_all_37_19]PIR07662.1 MAG: reactive intermediate/imine deaminase [Candidatus Gottesmanbacteria bacterium CG11_big_fil_rev_8_21_14_0_20_37_11]PIZ03084.1 MAG: reactive intermediate/imine deaminase [Candidatus Gottesmanbacteria bacterium CG_4_10_14_0_8_um_filter_37_24]